MTHADSPQSRIVNPVSESDRFEVAVDSQTWSQFFPCYLGALPGLLISDGVTQAIFTSGARRHEAQTAREFAISLAFNALAFASECNKRLIAHTNDWPEDDATF